MTPAILVGTRVLFFVGILTAYGVQAATVAHSQSLSKIRAEQLTRILQLPRAVTVYEPPAVCADPTNSRCSDMDRARVILTVSEDGQPQVSQCGQMRLFRFAGVTHLNLLTGVCDQGPLTIPELKETIDRSQRVNESFFESAPIQKTDKNPILQFREARTVSVGAGETAHIFTVLLFGHGIGLLPTAVVTTPLRNTTFVVQLFIVPDGHPEEDKNPMAKLFSGTYDKMESLVKELYSTTR